MIDPSFVQLNQLIAKVDIGSINFYISNWSNRDGFQLHQIGRVLEASR